jgi:hypothetical protein
MRPAGLFKWAIDGYDARGGWQVTISPDGMSRRDAKKELKQIRARARNIERKKIVKSMDKANKQANTPYFSITAPHVHR